MARVRDVNRIPAVIKELQKMSMRQAEVGIFEDAPRLVTIATQNEFGANIEVTDKYARKLRALARQHNISPEGLPRAGETLRIPERSFLRSTFDEQQDQLTAEGRTKVQDVMSGEADAYTALRSLGEKLQRAVIEKVRSGDFAPNDPLTIAVKGHARPLIGETGVLETTKGIRVRVVRKR